MPSGLNARSITPLCLSGCPIGLPLGISHICTALLSSPPAAASLVPSGLNASAIVFLNVQRLSDRPAAGELPQPHGPAAGGGQPRPRPS